MPPLVPSKTDKPPINCNDCDGAPVLNCGSVVILVYVFGGVRSWPPATCTKSPPVIPEYVLIINAPGLLSLFLNI